MDGARTDTGGARRALLVVGLSLEAFALGISALLVLLIAPAGDALGSFFDITGAETTLVLVGVGLFVTAAVVVAATVIVISRRHLLPGNSWVPRAILWLATAVQLLVIAGVASAHRDPGVGALIWWIVMLGLACLIPVGLTMELRVPRAAVAVPPPPVATR
jgi:hypothetical protein